MYSTVSPAGAHFKYFVTGDTRIYLSVTEILVVDTLSVAAVLGATRAGLIGRTGKVFIN